MSFNCPTCGQPVEDRPAPARLVAATPLGALESRIVDAMLDNFGDFMTRTQVVNRAYGASRSRERYQALADAIGRINQKLLVRGLVVERARERNDKLPLYRLSWAVEILVCENCGNLYPADDRVRLCTCGGRLVSRPVFEELRKAARESQAA